ncbi:MAG: response regulator transcription factor, partial [Ruminococcaceae bacterium]|nr:response regulator transcription factor [Oscillospiraceae bacterium]
MMRIALCDDEQKILDEVSQYINKYAERKNIQSFEVFSFDSARALKNALDDEKSFDIFVLDVYIGKEMGTALAKEIRKRGIESPIVFLTTSVEHAPQGYETGTLRYLIKPLDPKKFYEALDAAFLQVEKVSERLVKLKTENGIESINANLIMYSEAHDHYQYVVLRDNRKIKVRTTVTDLLSTLMRNGGFVRVGSAYIVNLRNVKNVSTHKVDLYHDMSVPIPRGK